MNLILLGPPGAGKGTQAAWLREELGITYIATGDLLRQHRADGTALGREAAEYMADGRLVPDELVVSMIMERIARDPAARSCSTASRAPSPRRTGSRTHLPRMPSS